MSEAQIISYLEMIEELSRLPLYNSLEVGFRHSPLSQKEQLDRYAETCSLINNYAQHMIAEINRSKDEKVI